ncbi:MAG: hypothetical protein IPG17_34205 [Sandaracinaceae bacterium]|jgi:hypothetical protein|nr:hypothetical protein [Sandaracinaceae bacterium]MBK7150915.1 hypothetical protein [Sandaracinaceae bacterium]MBK7773040.1 hypothetical protein [Sandaracinaceae bacterium]MBK8407250.1 hypothetical protein [Sandaracinaceae bacterium]MBK8589359.1 hypothetical protein [Sandaracinaceae bacterium]
MIDFYSCFVERPVPVWRRAFVFSLCLLPGCGSGAAAGLDAAVDGHVDDAGVESGRLVVVGPDGEIASLDLAAPFTVRASDDLDAVTSSVKCAGARCVVVHPAPSNTVDLVDARTLSVTRTFTLARGADPRDAAWVGDDIVVVSQYESAEVVVIDATALTVSSIDLAALADADGLPEPAHVASCGQRAFVQLARIDHESGAVSDLGPALAVLDFSSPAGGRVVDVDPDAVGVQGVALNSQAEFDMPVDCARSRLFVAEPRPLFSGGGGYEVVNLSTLVVSVFDFANGAQVGGFEVVDDVLGWRITHTDFGPGASSHLELVGAGAFPTYNSFSSYYVDQLALDTVEDLLFFPDPCTITPSNQACERGVHVFHARSGEVASGTPVDVGFDAIDLAVAR